MSCFRPVTAWRTPADVRPTPGASVRSFAWACFACCIDKCLRALPVAWEVALVTCCLRRAHPLGVARRLQSACGVASCCRPPMSAPPRTPRLRSWSWMWLMLKAGGRQPPVPKNTVRLETTTASPWPMPRVEAGAGSSLRTCYLVDPASSHMLVSKIKPCMCKYELIRTVKLRMAH